VAECRESPILRTLPALDVDLSALAFQVPKLRQQLLGWWELQGRHTIPWKLTADGRRPADGEELDPYPVFVAEVMLRSAA